MLGLNIIGAVGALTLMPNLAGMALSAGFICGMIYGLCRSRP